MFLFCKTYKYLNASIGLFRAMLNFTYLQILLPQSLETDLYGPHPWTPCPLSLVGLDPMGSPGGKLKGGRDRGHSGYLTLLTSSLGRCLALCPETESYYSFQDSLLHMASSSFRILLTTAALSPCAKGVGTGLWLLILDYRPHNSFFFFFYNTLVIPL